MERKLRISFVRLKRKDVVSTTPQSNTQNCLSETGMHSAKTSVNYYEEISNSPLYAPIL